MAVQRKRTMEELEEELFALRLEIAFQKMEQREAEALIAECEQPDPEMDSLIEQTIGGGNDRVLRMIRAKSRAKRRGQLTRRVLPRLGIVLGCLLLAFYIGLTVVIAATPSMRTRALELVRHVDNEPEEAEQMGEPAFGAERFSLVMLDFDRIYLRDEDGNLQTISTGASEDGEAEPASAAQSPVLTLTWTQQDRSLLCVKETLLEGGRKSIEWQRATY